MSRKTTAMEQSRKIGDIIELNDLLELILNNVYSGIIFCDGKARILFMNQVYADLLGTDRKKAIGRHITDFFPSSRLPEVLEKGQAELGERCSLKTEATLLVNRIPIKRNGVTRGVILQTIFKNYQAFTDLVSKMNLLEREVKYQKSALHSVLSARYTFDSIIGPSSAVEDVKAVCRKYAQTDAPILLLGATGTGKELFAHAVHTGSGRSAGPFVSVNCAAIPRELLESELFGYESGAFTGAARGGKTGRIELSHRGTLYLDEIAELPLNAQAKLLRVLEDKVLDKLGGVKSFRVDFRLVASTNRDLRQMIGRGEFREDLYYRLNTMTVQIPALAQRIGDIPVLVDHFLAHLEKPEVRLSQEVLKVLRDYPWPGNLRELRNVIERAVSVAEGKVIRAEHLPPEVLRLSCDMGGLSGSSDGLLAEELARWERSLLSRVVGLNHGNMSKASKILGISRSTLYEKCRKYGLRHIPG